MLVREANFVRINGGLPERLKMVSHIAPLAIGQLCHGHSPPRVPHDQHVALGETAAITLGLLA